MSQLIGDCREHEKFGRFVAAHSLHQLELARFLGFVEPSLLRTVETKQDIPAFAGHGGT
jgi:hypothetical protein